MKAGAAQLNQSVMHLNPEGLHKSPVYSQAVVTQGAGKTVYIGGQNALDEHGGLVGKGDVAGQTEQVFKNLQTALTAAGAGLENIIKWNLYLVNGQPLQPGFEVFQRFWGKRPNLPVITAVFVSGLANPDYLVEMDAIAFVPEE